MRYLGGKTRIAKHIAAEIDKVRKPGQWVWDPFCGGLSTAVALSKNGPVFCSDNNPALIALYQAARAGWQPPTVVTREQYSAAKLLPDSDPLKAFCGFGCSFGGKWFASFADGFNGPLTYAQLAARNVQRAAPVPAEVVCIDFCKARPQAIDAVIYLDPPYAGTVPYRFPFDSAAFLLRAAGWAAHTDVFVSEYAFPLGTCVWQHTRKITFASKHGKNPTRTERLYHLPKGSTF